MKTYEVIQVVEMVVTWKVRASSAEEANEIATQRTQERCRLIAKRARNVQFGDVNDNYVPARD